MRNRENVRELMLRALLTFQLETRESMNSHSQSTTSIFRLSPFIQQRRDRGQEQSRTRTSGKVWIRTPTPLPPPNMSKSIISSNNDHLSQLARTQYDLIIAQLQNEIIKVEMDKLRKEKMVLEGAYERVRGSLEEIRKDDRERIIAVPKNNTAQ